METYPFVYSRPTLAAPQDSMFLTDLPSPQPKSRTL